MIIQKLNSRLLMAPQKVLQENIEASIIIVNRILMIFPLVKYHLNPKI
jgi:hypothetical protein